MQNLKKKANNNPETNRVCQSSPKAVVKIDSRITEELGCSAKAFWSS